MTPGWALLPLRLFLGITFVYAGLEKLADPGFLQEGARTYIGTQLAAFAKGTPGGWLLETFALPYPKAAGVGVALTEIVVGLLVTVGLYLRPAAAAGLALNLVLFLTATWHTQPYFLGADIAFVFAWLPFVLVGAEGQPALAHRPDDARLYTRRVALATAILAGVTVLTRGRYVPPPPPGTRLAAASAINPGEAISVTAQGSPALLVRSADGRLRGFGATCTHAGCDVEYLGGRLVCPCHGAEFDPATGAPTIGPAQAPLTVLDVREQDGQVYLA